MMKYIIYEDKLEAADLPGRSLKWLVSPEMEISDSFSMNVVVIKPGNTVKPAHAHPKIEETIYVSRGKGKAFIDGVIYEIYEGTTVLFKPGSVHMLRNDGNEDMKVLCFFTPPATLNDYIYYEEIEFPTNDKF